MPGMLCASPLHPYDVGVEAADVGGLQTQHRLIPHRRGHGSLTVGRAAFAAAIPPWRSGTMFALARLNSYAVRRAVLARTAAASTVRALHASALQHELSKLTMPAMSPTMQDGNIHSWRKKNGESYSAGEVILEIVRGLWPWVPALTGRKRTRRPWRSRRRMMV